MSATFVTDIATVVGLTLLFLKPTVVAFAFLTPFFFLKGGMNVSTSALWGSLGTLAVLFAG